MLTASQGNMYKGSMFKKPLVTWNPLGGQCFHNCNYCIEGTSKILMSDFSEKNIKDIKEGDEIVGLQNTGKIGEYKKFCKAKVIAISKREALTIKINTNDSHLICTREHLLLGECENRIKSDWRQAKYFSPFDKIRYLGMNWEKNDEYKKGWLSGYIEGDGCFSICKYKNGKKYLIFEIVSVNSELLETLDKYSKHFGVELKKGIKRTTKKCFSKGKNYQMLGTWANKNAKKLQRISMFNKNKSDAYYKGYLGGIIDAEGTILKYIRIAQSKKINKDVFNHIKFASNKLKIPFVEEERYIRLIGGLKTRLFILFNCGVQCIHKRERLLFGYSIKGTLSSTVKEIQTNKKIYVYNIQTECENYIANGFIIHNCHVHKGRMKALKKYYGDSYLSVKELNIDLYKCKNLKPPFIVFVCSCNDLFTKQVPTDMIEKIIWKCNQFPENTYLFQSKNPWRFTDFLIQFPKNVILATTIESNRDYPGLSNAPLINERVNAMNNLSHILPTMITLEPLLKFDVQPLFDMIKDMDPTYVSIGADSKNCNLSEPSKEEVEALLSLLKTKTTVEVKENLGRLLK